MNELDNPRHDQLFRKTFENPLVAQEFMQDYLPKEVLERVDLSTLKLEKDTFVDDDLNDTACDVLFSVELVDKIDNQKQPAFIYLLTEHQSKPDHFMAFRLMKYMLSICDQYLSKHKNSKYLPIVYPVLLYNGKTKYTAPLNIWQLFSDPAFMQQLWNKDYQLVNVHDIPDSELKKHIWAGITLFLMKHIHERNMLKYWQEIKEIIPEIVKIDVGYKHIKLLLRYSLTRIAEDDKISLQQLLTETINEKEGENIMASLARTWFNDGVSKGKLEGKTEGKIEGKIETARNLLKAGISIEVISVATGLSLNELQKLV